MAASGFSTPSLSWNSPNLPEAFRSFRQYSTLIFDGPFANKSEKEKVTYLLLWIGIHGRDIYDEWTWTTPDNKFKLQIVLDKLPGQVQFPLRSTDTGRVRRRIHLTVSCSCRKMQVRGHIGSKHPPHRAIDSWNKTRRRSGKTPGERRRTRKPGHCLGHCPYLQSHDRRHMSPSYRQHQPQLRSYNTMAQGSPRGKTTVARGAD